MNDEMSNVRVIIPPLPEQTAIAQFLDHKTAQIDRAIAIKEEQIKLLNERKQIMIQEAVTKGLDPTVPMKDSGVEWLEDIPVDWDVIKMQYLFKDISIKNRANAELLSVTQNQGVVPRTWVENRMVMPSGNLESFKYIEKGDFAISLRSFEGGLEYCHANGIISPAYTVLKSSHEQVNARYFKYLFKSYSFISELQLSVVGIREGRNVSYSLLSQSIMPIPPLPEQTAIAQFLDHKTVQLDRGVEKIKSQIQTLKEYKTTLINEAVTGKIKVY